MKSEIIFNPIDEIYYKISLFYQLFNLSLICNEKNNEHRAYAFFITHLKMAEILIDIDRVEEKYYYFYDQYLAITKPENRFARINLKNKCSNDLNFLITLSLQIIEISKLNEEEKIECNKNLDHYKYTDLESFIKKLNFVNESSIPHLIEFTIAKSKYRPIGGKNLY